MNYDLVFEGGGAKGLVFVGAMQAFETAGHTFQRVIGTSAGAITATLLAAEYNAEELLQAINEKTADGEPRFSTFMDIPESFDKEVIENSLTAAILDTVDNPFLPNRIEAPADRKILNTLLQLPVYRNLFSFVELGGWYDGVTFLNWLQEKLNSKGKKLGEATFAEFHKRRPNQELTVIAADTDARERLILNHRTTPDLPVVWAVRMSMSIPFLWQEVIWQKEWGLYQGRNITGHTIVDGGVLSNFAMDLLVTKDPKIRKIMGPVDDKTQVLGFLIDEDIVVPGAADIAVQERKELKPKQDMMRLDVQQAIIVQRITRLIDTITNAHDKTIIREYKDRVCRLPAQGYGTTEFGMSPMRIDAIVAAGRKTMSDFLQRTH